MSIKKVLDAIGYSGEYAEDKVDEVVNHISENLIPIKDAHLDDRVIQNFDGKTYGALTTTILNHTDLDKNEIKGRKIEETVGKILEDYNSKVKGYQEEIEKVKKTAGQSQTKQVNDLQAKVTDLEKAVEDYRSVSTEYEGKYKEAITEKESAIQNYKLDMNYQQLKSGVKWSDKATADDKEYIDYLVKRDYKLDLEKEGDKEMLVIKDKEGHRIKKEGGAGFAQPEEIITGLVEKRGLLAKNNLKQKGNFNVNLNKNAGDDGDQPKRRKARSRIN